MILDFNAAGHVVGLELLGLAGRVSPEHLRVLQFETAEPRPGPPAG